MKKIIKSFTFWFLLIALSELYMHQTGQDSKSIILISLNPILSTISHSERLIALMNSGVKIPCRTIMGSISVYWYVASVISLMLYGILLDLFKIIIVKIANKTE